MVLRRDSDVVGTARDVRADRLALRLAAHIPQRSITTVTTNVPGPRRPLSILGHEILEIFPYVPIALRLRTGIAT